MTLKFNGTALSTNQVFSNTYNTDGVNSTQILANFSGNKGISFMIQDMKVGTYNVSDGVTLLSFSPSTNFADTYIADAGHVTITAITSDAVTGTFEFSGTNENGDAGSITDGKFTARIVKGAGPINL